RGAAEAGSNRRSLATASLTPVGRHTRIVLDFHFDRVEAGDHRSVRSPFETRTRGYSIFYDPVWLIGGLDGLADVFDRLDNRAATWRLLAALPQNQRHRLTRADAAGRRLPAATQGSDKAGQTLVVITQPLAPS